MSCGIPVVASSVGVNHEIIQDGINGFLTDNEEDWLNKISLLIEDRFLRGKIGLEGRKTVEHKYSVRVNAPILKEVIERSCQ
jgi:glycosyltransferase involved in cell wall biosynthesis